MSVCINFEIERLINFAIQNILIEPCDINYIRNHYLNLFNETTPKKYDIDENLLYPDLILENMYQYVVSNKLNLGATEDIIKCRIMDILIPRPNIVRSTFNLIHKNHGINLALQYFYNLSIASNYIKVTDIQKNQHWLTKTQYGDLEITINLSKPEKDPKEIAMAKLQPKSDHPNCLLCLENEGFAGDYNKPSRFTHRVIPLSLNDETWYFQFSPYAYYANHSIIFSSEHRDMKISSDTFKALFDFVDLVPQYIIGANADIPIVGGSILTHDHFQAGSHVFPMEKAKTHSEIIWNEVPNIKGYILDWPLSVIKLIGTKDDLLKLGVNILSKWVEYSDESVDIVHHTTERHNTLNPIVRKTEDDKYELYLILRNNRKNETYPDGIFHPHREFHNIKKENIGLIEAMGLAILPGRLDNELEQIAVLLNYPDKINDINKSHPLWQHKDFIKEVCRRYDPFKSDFLKKEVGQKFMQVLECSGVFKNDNNGIAAFKRFITHINAQIV